MGAAELTLQRVIEKAEIACLAWRLWDRGRSCSVVDAEDKLFGDSGITHVSSKSDGETLESSWAAYAILVV